MNLLKTIAAVSAIAVSSFSVNAEVITVGGITWDTQYDDNYGATTYSQLSDFILTMTSIGPLTFSSKCCLIVFQSTCECIWWLAAGPA